MILRRIEKRDLEIRVDWMNNPAVYESMHFEVPITLPNTLNWFEKIKENDSRIDFAIENDSTLIGFGGLTQIDKQIKKAEFYIFINPKQHGKGFGTRAVRKILNYAFCDLRLNRIWLITDFQNLIARKMYEKCGFLLEGILRQDDLRNNNLIDRCRYAILKSDFDDKLEIQK